MATPAQAAATQLPEGYSEDGYHFNAVLLFEDMDECLTDQRSKGVPDSKAEDICNRLMRAMTANSTDPWDGFQMNTVDYWEDDKFVYVPVVLTSEGVHNGAFKSHQELEKAFPFCENLPICILHPPGRGVVGTDEVHGWVRDTEFEPETAKIKGTAQFIKGHDRLEEYGHDEQSLEAHQALLEAIRMGAKFDGSIGYWHGTINDGGVFQGTRYDRREVNILPDHLAVVDRGASDWEMGTGFGQDSEDGCGCKSTSTGCGCPTPNEVSQDDEPLDPEMDEPDATPEDAEDREYTENPPEELSDEGKEALKERYQRLREEGMDRREAAKEAWAEVEENHLTGNKKTGTYDDLYQGRGEPLLSNVWQGLTLESDDHQHPVTAAFEVTFEGEEDLTVRVTPPGPEFADPHAHDWEDEDTGLSSEEGHSHDLPEEFWAWLEGVREQAQDRLAEHHPGPPEDEDAEEDMEASVEAFMEKFEGNDGAADPTPDVPLGGVRDLVSDF